MDKIHLIDYPPMYTVCRLYYPGVMNAGGTHIISEVTCKNCLKRLDKKEWEYVGSITGEDVTKLLKKAK